MWGVRHKFARRRTKRFGELTSFAFGFTLFAIFAARAVALDCVTRVASVERRTVLFVAFGNCERFAVRFLVAGNAAGARAHFVVERRAESLKRAASFAAILLRKSQNRTTVNAATSAARRFVAFADAVKHAAVDRVALVFRFDSFNALIGVRVAAFHLANVLDVARFAVAAVDAKLLVTVVARRHDRR